LTRRAKHLHTFIIGKFGRPAREIAAGFLLTGIRIRSGGVVLQSMIAQRSVDHVLDMFYNTVRAAGISIQDEAW
jgi:hypothetical protein